MRTVAFTILVLALCGSSLRPATAGTVPSERGAARELPPTIVADLGRRYPDWHLALPTDETLADTQRVPGRRREQFCFVGGDFDGNGQRDYAVLFVPHARATSAFLLVYLRRGRGYRYRTVSRSGVPGGSTLAVAAAGTKDYDYTHKHEIVYRLDTVQMYQGMGGIAFLYVRGNFVEIVCSD